MGKKSDKKVKSERVNVLRKQYDAFLEEDKKRKERNEYILGRLDNMRYSSTAVQIRHKPIVYGDVMPVYNRGAYRSEQFKRRDLSAHPDHQINQMQLDVPNKYLDNTSLLNEISKKYILIPKLRSLSVNDYVATIPSQSLPPIAVSSPQSNITSNEDWKSKYDILEQLKKKEKQEQTGKYANDEIYPVKEKQTPSKDTKVIDNFSPMQDINGFKIPAPERGDGYALKSYNTKEFTTKYEQEVAEKDLTFNKDRVESEPQHLERPKISDNKDQEPITDQAPNISASAYTNPKTNTAYDDYKLQNTSLENHAPVEEGVSPSIEQNVYDSNYPNENVVQSEYTEEEITNNSENQINDIPHQAEYPIQYEQPIEVEGKFPDSENVYLDRDDYSPIQVLDPSAVVQQLPNEPTVNETTTIQEDEMVEYPVEMLNVQDFTPKDDVKLVDGENVNPKYLVSEDKTEPVYENNPGTETVNEYTVDPQDSSGIEAFDAEQAEMFYSEDTSEYTYEQQQNNAYNQDEANAPAQDYAYYESPDTALQEQEYPAEINEHEESNARYDQNYEQQYATEYEQQEYVQPEGYDQTEQQNYVQPEGYDQTEQQNYVQPEGYDQNEQEQYVGYDQTEQQYGYHPPDQDTVQNIEQVLDNEAGYVDQPNPEAPKVETLVEPASRAADQNTA